MTHYAIKTSHLVGFAAEKSEAGNSVKVYTKCNLSTSNDPVFHVWMKHISDLFFSKTSYKLELIYKFLIILHPNDDADIYINDFQEISTAKVNKTIKAGEKIFVNDIDEIKELKFPDIEIKKDDAVIYGLRHIWRFSLYFDFERQIDLDTLSKELAKLKAEAIFYSELASTNAQASNVELNNAKAIIFTEGKTDWKHLSKSMEKLNIQMDIAFNDDDKDRGSDDLYKMCEHYAVVPHSLPMIFVFDRDEDTILKKLKAKEKNGEIYQAWGNNVYSLYLPEPKNREEKTHSICIEFYYSDNEIKTLNSDGKRLFFSNEFNKRTGNHSVEQLHCTELNKIKHDKIGIIDSGVYEQDNKIAVISKNEFAESIMNGKDNFNNFDHSEFKKIFDIFDEIINLKLPK